MHETEKKAPQEKGPPDKKAWALRRKRAKNARGRENRHVLGGRQVRKKKTSRVKELEKGKEKL